MRSIIWSSTQYLSFVIELMAVQKCPKERNKSSTFTSPISGMVRKVNKQYQLWHAQ